MTEVEAVNEAESYLLGASNDEGWIDASSGYAKSKLVALIKRIHEQGSAAGAKGERESREAHAALGAWPGAFDE